MKIKGKTVWKIKPRCPTCRNNDRVRTRPGGFLRFVYRWFGLYPFRCESCGSRFYRKWRYTDEKPLYDD